MALAALMPATIAAALLVAIIPHAIVITRGMLLPLGLVAPLPQIILMLHIVSVLKVGVCRIPELAQIALQTFAP